MVLAFEEPYKAGSQAPYKSVKGLITQTLKGLIRQALKGLIRPALTSKRLIKQALKDLIMQALEGPIRPPKRGFPRDVSEAHEDSQEAPKELQHLKKQGIQKWTQKILIFSSFVCLF
jgi:hypothetical protein